MIILVGIIHGENLLSEILVLKSSFYIASHFWFTQLGAYWQSLEGYALTNQAGEWSQSVYIILF